MADLFPLRGAVPQLLLGKRHRAAQARYGVDPDDMREAMTLIAHGRVQLSEFLETVYPLEKVGEAMEDFITDRRIKKVQIAVA